jgi:hypothetical protein
MVLGGGTVTTPSFIGHIGGAATKPSQLAWHDDAVSPGLAASPFRGKCTVSLSGGPAFTAFQSDRLSSGAVRSSARGIAAAS